MRIVIIGNGVAGLEAATAVRAEQPAWDITLISEESDHFFSRTALMWVAAGQLCQRDIEPHARDFYARMGFRRVRGRATGIDPDARCVRMAGQLGPVPYDRLLLCSGSRPRRGPFPGADLTGVGHFVTLQDLAWLEGELRLARGAEGPPRPDAHLSATSADSPYRKRPLAAAVRGRAAREAAVIGGGLIGIEAIEVLLAAGLRPRFFIREEWFWPMAIDRAESAWIGERMREHGVEVHLEHAVEALVERDGLVAGVQTDRGRFDADLVLVAIGVEPNTAFLSDSPIALHPDGGVLVDAGLATSLSDVFAAGDCAAVPQGGGIQRPEQLWYTARAQGRVAGLRLLGQPAEYVRGQPFNSAKLMDIEFTTAGQVGTGGADAREWFFEERGAVRSTTRIATHGERVVGFNSLGRRWDHSVLIDWIERGKSLAWVLDHLSEASFDTEFVPPLSLPAVAKRAGAVPVAGGA